MGTFRERGTYLPYARRQPLRSIIDPGMTAGSAPGRCAPVSTATAPGAPIVLLDDSRRDGPWEAETGHLAGWEVELPTKTVGRFWKREALVVTSLPHGLTKVMGEDEYQEQVVAIRELTEAHSKRLLNLKLYPLALYLVAIAFGVILPLILAIPMILGIMNSEAYGALTFGFIALIILASPLLIIGLVYAHYRAGMAGKTMGYEIARATAHWEARGIAWRLKTSNPLPRLSGGENPQVVAAYKPRVYVECAPDAIELFETHGPFNTTGAVPRGVENYSDYGSVSDADRGSKRLSGGADGTPKFALAFSDIFFNRIRHMVPKRPMMLRNVMGANEFAEQVGVINRDIDRLSKPWKISYTVFIVSAMLIIPATLLCMGPFVVWAVLGLDSNWWFPISSMFVILLVPILGLFGGLVAVIKTRKSSEMKLAVILDQLAARWESRGIEWFFSEEKYHLSVGIHSKEHTERRVTVRVRPEAVDKFQTMGPFPPGAIDGAVCVTYDLTAF